MHAQKPLKVLTKCGKKPKLVLISPKKSYDRVERLFQKGVITAQKRDEVEAQYKAAVATAAAAKSQYTMAKNGADTEDKLSSAALVDKAKGAIQEVEAFLAETILLSPISGEVTEVFPLQEN